MTKQGHSAWFDLFVSDIEKAKTFYGELFNWSTEEWRMDAAAPAYTMFKVDGKPMGGVTAPVDSAVNNSWLAYVTVENIDAAITVLKKNSGQVLLEEQIPSVGRYAIAKDAQGAVFAPFEPENKNEPVATHARAPIGNFCWHELMCSDREKAFGFYKDVFGWDKGEAIDMGPMGVYQIYNNQGSAMGGIMNITPDMPIKTPYWLEYVRVDNVDATIERALKLGGHATFPAMDVGDGGRIAGFVDNQGVQCAVWSGAK